MQPISSISTPECQTTLSFRKAICMPTKNLLRYPQPTAGVSSYAYDSGSLQMATSVDGPEWEQDLEDVFYASDVHV